MSDWVFNCFVSGDPKSQGGFTSLRLKNGRTIRKPAGSSGLSNWRSKMASVFELRLGDFPYGEWPLDCALKCRLTFVLPRLKGHKDGLAYDAHKELDLDKLIRAAWDSLKRANVITNDSRFCRVEAVKRYAHTSETPGLLIKVGRLSGPELMEIQREPMA
jgi:Holliday junction resolvase RusA-like endonuclease